MTTSVVTSISFFRVARQRYDGALPSGYLVPVAPQLVPGDLVNLHVTTYADPISAYAFRNVDTYRAGVAAQTVELPPPWLVDPPTFIATPFRRPAFALPVVPDATATQSYEVQLTADVQPSPSQLFESHYWSVSISPRYAAGQPLFTYTAPDLSALAGWSDAMALPTGTSVRWNILLADRKVASPLHASDGDVTSNTGVGGEFAP